MLPCSFACSSTCCLPFLPACSRSLVRSKRDRPGWFVSVYSLLTLWRLYLAKAKYSLYHADCPFAYSPKTNESDVK